MKNDVYHLRWDGNIRLDLECPLINHHQEMIVYKEIEAEKGIHYHAAVEIDKDKKELNNLRQKIIYWLRVQLEERYPDYVAKRRLGKKREPQWLSVKKCRPKAFIAYISKEGECVRNSELLRLKIQELKQLDKKQLKDKQSLIYVEMEKKYQNGQINTYYESCQALYYLSKEMLDKPYINRSRYITIAHSLGIIQDDEMFRRLGILRYDENPDGHYEHKEFVEQVTDDFALCSYVKKKIKKRVISCGKKVCNSIIKSSNIL